MQTVKTILVIACMAICATTIHAQGEYMAVHSETSKPTPFSFNVYAVADSGSIFRIVVDNPDKKELHLSITHAVFGQLYDTMITEKQFASRYNFSAAEDGRYRIIIRHGKEKISKVININTITTVIRQVSVQ